MQRFNGKRVLITGSGRGIGAAIARRFALEGASVFLTARGEEELTATRGELRSLTTGVESLALDLMESDSARILAAEVQRVLGGLDILVTNAGSAPQGSFLDLGDEEWSQASG